MAVMDELATMDPDQLRQLVTRASYLLDPTGTAPAVASAPSKRRVRNPDEGLLWTECERVLSKAGKVPPLSVVRRMPQGAAALREAVQAVFETVQHDFKTEHRAERIKVVRLLVGLTAQDLAERGKLVPLRLLQRLRYCERTVDRHFPGYRASGLLHIVLSHVKGK